MNVNKENIYGPSSRYHTFLIIQDLGYYFLWLYFYGNTKNIIFHNYITIDFQLIQNIW